MNITENYIGYDALVSYLIESKNQTYYRFLNLNRDIIISSLNSLTNFSLTLDKWQNFDITWYKRYLYEAKKLFEPDIFVAIKDKVRFLFCKVWVTPKTYNKSLNENYWIRWFELQIFWQEIIKDFDISEISQSNLPKKKQKVIKKCDKKNLTLTELSQPDTSLPKKTETLQPDLQVVKEYEKENLVLAQPDVSLSKKIVKIPVENYSETLQSVLPKKKFQFTDFCYDILHELENKSYANLFYKYIEKDIKKKIIKYPMDLFTINLKLKNNQYTSLEEFEKDIRLIFCN
ncbi:6711_t:CDS:2, partial [Rhizophagus irregularis]